MGTYNKIEITGEVIDMLRLMGCGIVYRNPDDPANPECDVVLPDGQFVHLGWAPNEATAWRRALGRLQEGDYDND